MCQPPSNDLLYLRQDLFFGDQVVRRAPSASNVTACAPPGCPMMWYLDYSKSTALLNFDPGTGGSGGLEVSWQDTWLSAPAGGGVSIEGLVIEKVSDCCPACPKALQQCLRISHCRTHSASLPHTITSHTQVANHAQTYATEGAELVDFDNYLDDTIMVHSTV